MKIKYNIVTDILRPNSHGTTEVMEYVEADQAIFNDGGGVMFCNNVKIGQETEKHLVKAYAAGHWCKVSVSKAEHVSKH
jgi:hypothetical protein